MLRNQFFSKFVKYALILCIAQIVHFNAYAHSLDRTITLSAKGVVEAKPNIAHISAAVETFDKSAQAAVRQNSEKMAKIIEALEAKGVKKKYIKTTDFSVRPEYESYQVKQKENRNPEIIGYRVINTIWVTLTDVKKLGSVLDEVVTLGANRIGGISFSVKDADSLLDAAREKAMQKAFQRARLYAKSARTRLGKVMTIKESASQISARSVTSLRSFSKASAVPVSPGSTEVEVRVTVTWKLWR